MYLPGEARCGVQVASGGFSTEGLVSLTLSGHYLVVVRSEMIQGSQGKGWFMRRMVFVKHQRVD